MQAVSALKNERDAGFFSDYPNYHAAEGRRGPHPLSHTLCQLRVAAVWDQGPPSENELTLPGTTISISDGGLINLERKLCEGVLDGISYF